MSKKYKLYNIIYYSIMENVAKKLYHELYAIEVRYCLGQSNLEARIADKTVKQCAKAALRATYHEERRPYVELLSGLLKKERYPIAAETGAGDTLLC